MPTPRYPCLSCRRRRQVVRLGVPEPSRAEPGSRGQPTSTMHGEIQRRKGWGGGGPKNEGKKTWEAGGWPKREGWQQRGLKSRMRTAGKKLKARRGSVKKITYEKLTTEGHVNRRQCRVRGNGPAVRATLRPRPAPPRPTGALTKRPFKLAAAPYYIQGIFLRDWRGRVVIIT